MYTLSIVRKNKNKLDHKVDSLCHLMESNILWGGIAPVPPPPLCGYGLVFPISSTTIF